MAKSKPQPATPSAEPSAAYTVVARRYRPQQLAELIGQEHVADALTNALKSGRVAHAYLFTGARGVGKTSAARILAKALNCEKGPTPTPCDVCDSCKAIVSGDDVDVLEIDGASNNKVDEARDLRQGIGFRPTRSRYKIYIIDEVHMLTTGAFNALLKTLEEPPEHVKFILATTEVQKIPITILSRCQRFDFAHVGPTKIFDQLKRIVEREGHQADDDALRLVARRAAGSMRDSQSLLDQLLASSTGKLTAEHVATVLGTAGDDRVIELANAIIAGDAKTALDLIAVWVERGLQVGELVEQVVEYWRAMMLVCCGGAEVRELPVTPSQFEAVKKHAPAVSLDAILGGLEVLTATKSRMRGSTHTQVLLEMAVVRLCRLADLRSVADLIQWAEAHRASGGAVPVVAAPVRPTPAAEPVKKNDLMAAKLPGPDSPVASLSTVALTESALPDVWARFLQYMGERSPILAKQLSFSSSHAILGPNALAIRFPAVYSDAREACAGESAVQRMQDALKRVTGQAITIRLETDARAEAPNGTLPTVVQQPADRKRSLTSLPMFKRASEVLGAQVWHVDDDFNPVAPPRPDAKPDNGEDEDTETATDEG